MAISLLHLTDSSTNTKPFDEKILYHLSLDRSFAYLCPDVKKQERFFSVVRELTDNEQEIIYRQDIFRDFQANRGLLEKLISLFARFEALRSAQKTAGREQYSLSRTQTASLASSKNLLQAQALCLKRAMLFVKSFGKLLAEHSLISKGFKDFYNACRELCENENFPKLLGLCAKYESFSANGFVDFKFVINGSVRIADYALIDHRYIRITDPELKRKGFSLFKKADETSYPCERIYPLKNDFYDTLAVSALSELSKLLLSVSEQIFERFGTIGGELDFYDVALKYVDALDEKGIPYCFPKLSRNRTVRVSKLYDLYLVMSKSDPKCVVPNDLEMTSASCGVVLFGNNGSGKTVYLRSIGTMQLLAQAGVPIPCECAEIYPCSQMATQFSEAEKEFCEGNDAGRFEQEVRELSAMVDGLSDGALVFLNETFQSTAYAEGADGLYYILEYFSHRNIRWILVSHLRQLEERLSKTSATVLYTSDGYRIINKEK